LEREVSSKTAATLITAPCEVMGSGARLVELDCPCGTTRVAWMNAPNGVKLIDSDIARVALAKHLSEEPDCTCIRSLWRRHFDGAPLGEVVLVKGSR
jgi:hypothetical protein